jgi:hypothetical protein
MSAEFQQLQNCTTVQVKVEQWLLHAALMTDLTGKGKNDSESRQQWPQSGWIGEIFLDDLNPMVVQVEQGGSCRGV